MSKGQRILQIIHKIMSIPKLHDMQLKVSASYMCMYMYLGIPHNVVSYHAYLSDFEK